MKFDAYTEPINLQESENRRIRDQIYDQKKSEGRVWGAFPREWIRKLDIPRISEDILNGFREYGDTATLSDILDSLGLNGTIPSTVLSPVCPGKRIAGQAFTQKNLPVRKNRMKSISDNDFIAMNTKDICYLAYPGSILVIDSGGDFNTSSFGGMAAKSYKAAGIAGAIVWGAVRDIPSIRSDEFAVWSGGSTCISGKYRIFASEINGPVAIASVLVLPGDIIVADDNGICVIPFNDAQEVMSRLISSIKAEQKMEKLLTAGGSIDEIRSIDRILYRKS